MNRQIDCMTWGKLTSRQKPRMDLFHYQVLQYAPTVDYYLIRYITFAYNFQFELKYSQFKMKINNSVHKPTYYCLFRSNEESTVLNFAMDREQSANPDKRSRRLREK